MICATNPAVSRIHESATPPVLKRHWIKIHIMITYRYRLKPSRSQAEVLGRHLEVCRQVYNRLLREVDRARAVGTPLSWYNAERLLPEWKKTDFLALREVHSRVAMMAAKHLYDNIASLAGRKRNGRNVGKLRFKGKGSYNSLEYNQSGFAVDRSRGTISLSKVGVVRARFHRPLPLECVIKGVVVKRAGPQKWFACLQCEDPRSESGKTFLEDTSRTSGSRAVGIDLGITHFAADSGGHFAENPRYLEKSLKKVMKLQQQPSRKKPMSRRRQKARDALAKLHEKVGNQRRDFLHKLSRHYVDHYDLICAEDLDVAGMLQEKRAMPSPTARRTLRRHTADAGWRSFLNMVAYKAWSAGKQAVFVDPRGTSQECAACGATVQKQLWDRTHTCPQCGFTTDRDINASLVILKRGTGQAPTSVELAPLLRLAGASAGAEAGILARSRCIALR